MDSQLRYSFLSSSLFLNGLTLITLIAALTAKDQKMVNMMNLETSVSFVAALVYGMIITKLDSGLITLEDVTEYRYLDWAITTPMLLLVLLIYFKTPVSIYIYMIILLLNGGMLASGYLGETKRINKMTGGIVGFFCFALMLVVLGLYCLNSSSSLQEVILLSIFAVIWTSYGIAYYMDIQTKNLMYNALDIIAKVFFGIYIWIFNSNIFTDKMHKLKLI
jgi:hypothetical protein